MTNEQQERTRAAWESATVANLGPVLTEEQNDRIWAAIVAHRESGDTAAFVNVAREIAIETSDTNVRAALERAASTLPAIGKE